MYLGEKKYYRSKLLNHLKGSYGLSNMSTMLGLGIVKNLTKRIAKFMYLCELWIH